MIVPHTNLRLQLQRMPIVDCIRHNDGGHIEVPLLRIVDVQIEQQQMDEIDQPNALASHEFGATVAQCACKHVESKRRTSERNAIRNVQSDR